MAWLSHADQDQLPMPRQYSGSADRTGSRTVHGTGATMRKARHSGMVKLLFQEPNARPGSLPRARPVYPVDETEKYPTVPSGGGSDNTFGHGVLRLIACVAKVGISRMRAITEVIKPRPMRRLT